MCKVRCWRWLFGNEIPTPPPQVSSQGAITLKAATSLVIEGSFDSLPGSSVRLEVNP